MSDFEEKSYKGSTEWCINCRKKAEDLRMVKHEDRRLKIHNYGPIDKTCAFEDKYGKIKSTELENKYLHLFHNIAISPDTSQFNQIIKSIIYILLISPSILILLGLIIFLENELVFSLFLLFYIGVPNIIITVFNSEGFEDTSKVVMSLFFGLQIKIFQLLPEKLRRSIPSSTSSSDLSWSQVIRKAMLCNLSTLIFSPSILTFVSLMLFGYFSLMYYLVLIFSIILFPLILIIFLQFLFNLLRGKYPERLSLPVKRIKNFLDVFLKPKSQVGENLEENFNLYWDGKITKNTHPKLYYYVLFIYGIFAIFILISLIIFQEIILSFLLSQEYTSFLVISSFVVFEQVEVIEVFLIDIGITPKIWGYLIFVLTIISLLYVFGEIIKSLVIRFLVLNSGILNSEGNVDSSK